MSGPEFREQGEGMQRSEPVGPEATLRIRSIPLDRIWGIYIDFYNAVNLYTSHLPTTGT